MNAEETSRVLAMISTHYWQTANLAERNIELMVETWTMTLADIPLRPHIEFALADWFKTEKWPPQASEMRELALRLGGPTPRMIAEAELARREREYGESLRSEAFDFTEEAWEGRRRKMAAFRSDVQRELGISA